MTPLTDKFRALLGDLRKWAKFERDELTKQANGFPTTSSRAVELDEAADLIAASLAEIEAGERAREACKRIDASTGEDHLSGWYRGIARAAMGGPDAK